MAFIKLRLRLVSEAPSRSPEVRRLSLAQVVSSALSHKSRSSSGAEAAGDNSLSLVRASSSSPRPFAHSEICVWVLKAIVSDEMWESSKPPSVYCQVKLQEAGRPSQYFETCATSVCLIGYPGAQPETPPCSSMPSRRPLYPALCAVPRICNMQHVACNTHAWTEFR